MSEQETIDQIRQDINGLKSTLEYNRMLVDRLDRTLEKITEVSNGISRLLAVHENKLVTQEQLIDNLKIAINDNQSALIKKIEKDRFDVKKDMDTHSSRLRILERWRWILIGGAGLIAFIFSKTDFASLLVGT